MIQQLKTVQTVWHIEILEVKGLLKEINYVIYSARRRLLKIAYQDCWTCQLETGSFKSQWLETNSVFHQHYVGSEELCKGFCLSNRTLWSEILRLVLDRWTMWKWKDLRNHWGYSQNGGKIQEYLTWTVGM